MNRIPQLIILFVATIFFSSCNTNYTALDKDKTISGVYIMNEGGTVCYYDDDKDTLSLDIYQEVNNASLGEKLNAVSFTTDKGYIISYKSSGEQVIEVIDPKTFMTETSITGLSDLTDVLAVSDQFIYATQGDEGSEASGDVIVLDAETYAKTTSIKVGKNPTRMAYSQGKKVFVINSGSVSYPDSTVMEIDITKNEVNDTIYLEQVIDDATVKLKTPVEMVIDANQDVWVLCKGIENDAMEVVNAGLAKIAYGSLEVTVFPFKNGYVGNGRNCLAKSSSGVYIYYVNDGTYSMSIGSDELPDEKFFKGNYQNQVFDAIAINPKTGEYYCAFDDEGGSGNDLVYLFDRYGLNEDNKTIMVGTKPRDFIFYP